MRRDLEGLVRQLGEMEEGCGEFDQYLKHCQEELVRRKGDWRSWGQVMETKERWAARREGKVKETVEKTRDRSPWSWSTWRRPLPTR